MAKNKNRDRGKQHDLPASDRTTDESKTPAMDDRSEQIRSRIASSEEPSKGRQKRFGHN